MKVFIVFMAMMLVLTGFLIFSADMGRYVRLQGHLKALAEECAAGASLFTDAERYSAGETVIDYDDAAAYVGFMTAASVRGDPMFIGADITSTVRIFDDEKGYEGSEIFGIKKEKPAVVVTLAYTASGDIFRLPFLSEYNLTRTAAYQWEDGLESY